ncbi:conjugal transfer protein TrbF [Novosphingobium sp.]|uniref:conjugal transfer protein TrbF n=1 Tax=Novosphingobium sp. TaxID=1874826 RepID=UPI0031DE1724
MIFKRPIQRYSNMPEPETPWQRAGQIWDDRIGSARLQASNWRLMAFGALGLASCLAAALVWQSLQSRIVPYVVEVDHLGEPRAIAPADTAYRPSDPEISWFLARFISDVRARSLDPVLMRQDWLQAYDYAGTRGALFLDEYARANDPFAGGGDKTVSVEVTSVVRASDSSFQVKWTETSYDRGSLAGTARWTAILTISQRPPKNADVLRRNPLGLHVDAIAWSRELETASDRAPRPLSPAPAMGLAPEATASLN